jgi:Protein of unknown function (DUF3631)
VLWIAATHAQDAWEHATRLVAKSPVRRCGKSRLLELAGRLCHDVLRSVNISVAALVHSITDDDPPTVVVDEADTLFGTRKQADNNEDLRGILNAGHARDWPYIRWDLATHAREECPTFAMAALAGIGDLPDTIEDRAIIITLRRRTPGEQITKMRRRRDTPALYDLRDRLHQWIRAHLKELEAATPAVPVDDRAADTWEPLVAIADLAGGEWPELARLACKAMTTDAEADAEGTADERLLADLEPVLSDTDRLDSKTIVERLRQVEEAPWADWYGKGLDARGLAKLLRPYGIKPKVIRLGTGTARGYERADLQDAWSRYTHPTRNERNERNSAGQRVTPVTDSAVSVTDRNALTSDVTDVTGVTEGVGAQGRLLEYDPDDPARFTR